MSALCELSASLLRKRVAERSLSAEEVAQAHRVGHEAAAVVLHADGHVMLIKQGTQNLEAYNLWLQGHEYLTIPTPAKARKARLTSGLSMLRSSSE